MKRRFFDTNILIYAVTAGDPREARAMALLDDGGVVSVQVLNEFAHVAHRKLRFTWPEVTAALNSFRTLCAEPLPVTTALHEAALGLAARYRCSVCDALILAAALDAGCDTLLSEDLQDGQVIEGRLTISNPFIAAPPQ